MVKLRAIVTAIFLCIFLPELSLVANPQDDASDDVPLTPALFIFGDSLIDNGNNNYMITVARANYFPYGIDLGRPTGRFCNGLTVVDYGGLPLIPPYLSLTSTGRNILRGVNYASAAAGILDETGRHYIKLGLHYDSVCLTMIKYSFVKYQVLTFFLHLKGQRTTFNEQISQLEITVTQELPQFFQRQDELAHYLSKSVFLVNIGGNDYLNNYLLPSRYVSSRIYNGEAFADLLSNQLSAQLTVMLIDKPLPSIGLYK
ncbi:hypothetical protein Cgig2_034151 [Carnegiea gigantea]|uniref:GDSL esterase/lipase n=1 Tax=Carnegiea gigantea TaxID=171969 RepID=A0A9Q1JTQ4_9CARY|nr:hypothetical protein Cgig2_034151 [Carnegiea gigantea]